MKVESVTVRVEGVRDSMPDDIYWQLLDEVLATRGDPAMLARVNDYR